MNKNNFKFDLGTLPFYYKPLETSHNIKDIPDGMNMCLEYKGGFIRQVYNDEVEKTLNLAYEYGSDLSGLMDEDGIGKKYADDFFDYINRKIVDLNGKEILEIGCGTGYLLSRLYRAGGDCIGIEPGANAVIGKEKYNLNIIHDFFSPSYFDKQYDLIIFHCVLEHIYDTLHFLNDVKTLLKDEGRILLAVPDCETYIKLGDVSMLIHEHWNYFTVDSLNKYMLSQGLSGEYEKSEYSGAIFACLKKSFSIESNETLSDYNNVLSEYMNKVEKNKNNFVRNIDKMMSQNKSIGIYVPGRIINFWSMCYKSFSSGIRFFDDNDRLYQTYYPGINIAIENFDDFKSNPTDIMIIASITFGEVIKAKIVDSGRPCKIYLLEELLT